MSVEEDTELRDLVSQTLENNGVLAKIRAELRASIFLALEEQEVKTPFVNRPLKEYLGTPEGALGLCLVREFLEYLELDFTLSVFNSETHHGKGYEYSDRNKLMKDLHLTNINGKKGPLLAHLLQLTQQAKNISAFSGKEGSENGTDNCKGSSGDASHLHSSIHHQVKQVDTPNSSVAPLDQTFVARGASPPEVSDPVVGINDSESEEKSKKTTSEQSPRPQQPPPPQPERLQSHLQPANQNHLTMNSKSHNSSDVKSGAASTGMLISSQRGATKSIELSSNSRAGGDTSKKDSVESRSQEKETWPHSQGLSSKNALTSLSNLPPLGGLSQNRKEVQDKDSILSAVMNLESADNYEEDFQSTDSSALAADHSNIHQPSQGSKTTNKDLKDAGEKDVSDQGTNSPVGSISEEIDEDLNSGIDELLNSTASGENTLDATISNVTSQFADYVEEV